MKGNWSLSKFHQLQMTRAVRVQFRVMPLKLTFPLLRACYKAYFFTNRSMKVRLRLLNFIDTSLKLAISRESAITRNLLPEIDFGYFFRVVVFSDQTVKSTG